MTSTLTRRGWFTAACAWLLLCLVQSPGLTVADTKHDLVADPWGFLGQALSPWTDIFPLGQLQNQAYGYLFPHGLFFALLSPLPDWLTQRLWWALLLGLAFAGTVRLLEATGTGSRASRVTAAVLYALSPRILTTLGAISSEAWTVALVPWIMLPVVRLLPAPAAAPPGTVPSRRRTALAACSSAVAVLCLGAVNAVATAAAVVPAVVWWFVAGVCSADRGTRRTARRFLLYWVPALAAACFWWVGPLLVLGRYSPPFTDYIESAGITTHWFNLGEVLRGTTSWTPFLDGERQAGAALVTGAVFVAGTLAVALLGLAGLARRGRGAVPHRTVWLLMLTAGLLVFGVAGPFSPVHEAARAFLDGAGAPLRNLHKFDPLVHLPLVVGVAHLLAPVRLPSPAALAHPERDRRVVTCTAVVLLLAVVTAPAWSARLAPVDGYREVPSYWTEAADWLNDPAHGASSTRTMILPRAATARQSWGNTRDEPAQALLDVPWVVRDAVPLVPPEAIRGLDGVQREFDSGSPAPTLAGALVQQGVGYLLVRSDLVASADTPGSRTVLRTLQSSPGFTEVASFGDGEVRIFQVGSSTTAPRTVHVKDLDVVSGGAEVLPRLAAADSATGGSDPGGGGAPRDRLLLGDEGVDALVARGATGTALTVTDTPALREHSYGTVTSPDSAIRAGDDPWRGLNPVHDYPSGRQDGSGMTRVRESGGHIHASSSADDPTSLGGADTLSSVSAAVDGDETTAWYPTPGSPVNQSLTVSLDSPVHQMRLTAQAQGSALRVQVTTFLGDSTVASSTVRIPVGRQETVSLPPGDADRVELRITGAWGGAGVSELSLHGPDGEDITPRRDIVVPDPQVDGGLRPVRWVLGQEIPEGTMRRTVTVPENRTDDRAGSLPGNLPGTGEGMRVRMASSDCSAVTTVDGSELACGDTVTLSPGDHEVRSTARWVTLDSGERPAGTSGEPEAGPAATSDTSGTSGPDDRIVLTPTSVNPGRSAVLELDGQSVTLDPVTVNGWQQGWSVPASLSATLPSLESLSDSDLAAAVRTEFTATPVYRAWLAVGLGAALALLAAGALLLRSSRRTAPAAATDHTPDHTPGITTGSTPGITAGYAEDGAREHLAHGQAGSVLRRRIRVGAAVPAWGAVAWILAGPAGTAVAAVALGVLVSALRYRRPTGHRKVPAPVKLLAGIRARHILLVTGAAATALFTRGPWGGGGLSGDYAGASLTVQLLFVACLTAVVLPLPSARRDDHHRDTARRAGSSTSE